jgi:hypothetical protein
MYGNQGNIHMKRTRRKLDKKDPLTRLECRISEKDKNRIIFLAEQYAGGNITMWITHGALNAPRKYLVKRASK